MSISGLKKSLAAQSVLSPIIYGANSYCDNLAIYSVDERVEGVIPKMERMLSQYLYEDLQAVFKKVIEMLWLS